jgi:twinkle protein
MANLKAVTGTGGTFDMEGVGQERGEYLHDRGITAKTMEFYGVQTFLDDSGNPKRQEYVYPSGGKKVRYYPKSFSAVGLRSDELFGMNLFPAGSSKYVTIVEGEVDALSAYQMLSGGSNYVNPVVSLPSASPAKRLWENVHDWLDSFEKIVLSVDNDDAGNAVAAKIANLFPNKVYRVFHDQYKDANDFLQAGATQIYKNSWWAAKKYVPENVLNTSDQFLKLFHDTPNHQFVPTGIVALDDKIMGLMQGHFTVIKAQTGIGKTEVMRYLEYNLLQRGVPFAAWHLEETKLRSLLGLVSYEMKQNLTRRDLIEDMGVTQEVEDAIKNLTKDELFYQFYLPDGQGPDELIDQIRYFREACGVNYVFFEPIQDVVSGFNEDSKESTLADLSVRLSKLAAELGVGIVTIAHTNENGDPKYCKMIAQRASVIIDLQRDKQADNDVDRNTTHLYIEKNRPCSEEGAAGALRFDPKTFTLKEVYNV